MLSNSVMKLFLVEYLILAIICLFENNWGRLLYWISASGITLVVLMMK